jgi:monoamine oxidase
MARTRLFGTLRRIAARACAARPAPTRRVDAEQPLLTRRQLTLGAAELAAASALSACSSDEQGKRARDVRVAVIGAGIAGLHCAYRLQQSGVNVTVYEASTRVGGRMFTAREEDYADQTFELGGELFDSNHATMLALAEELEITLDDRVIEGIQNDVWFVAGAEVPEAVIVEQFTAVAGLMVEAVEAADSDDAAFEELDNTPLADWLSENVPAAAYPELHAVLRAAYRGEFGLEPSQQSSLNLLYLIGSDEPDPFRIFGESDERYHAREGSDAFPTRLAQRLAKDVVRFGAQLTHLSESPAGGYRLELTDPKADRSIVLDFDHVVLAIPFSVLRNVTLDVPLSEQKQQIIAELGYGTNAKVMGQFKTRVWREEHRKSGAVTSDLALQQTWDSSIGQPGERGILTNFLGGEAGVAVGDVDEEQYYTGLLQDLELLFPGVAEAYRPGSARRMHWPSYEHSLGSYTCYRPGQWSFWELEGAREGNLHFCGEHTSVDFQGWMEGGAETGALVAAEIITELGLEPSAELSALLALKTVVPQPALSRSAVGQLGYRERRRLLGSHYRSRPLAAPRHAVPLSGR